MNKNVINSYFFQACVLEDFKQMKELYRKGADVNHRNKWGNTPLNNAVFSESGNVVKWLIHHKANLNIPTFGELPIELAKKLKANEIIKILEKNGAKEIPIISKLKYYEKKKVL